MSNVAILILTLIDIGLIILGVYLLRVIDTLEYRINEMYGLVKHISKLRRKQ